MSNGASPRLNLPYLAAAQAQKHVTLNEALLLLDSLVQLSVIAVAPTEPSAQPQDGARFIVGAGASGAWTGLDGQVALWMEGAWSFHLAQAGWVAWCEAQRTLLVFDGAVWGPAPGAGARSEVSAIGIGAAADDDNPLLVRAPGALFTHSGGDCRVKVNKAGSADSASVVFQTGFSGRAEVGACGDDSLHVKLSSDGATWRDALIIDGVTGAVGVNRAPSHALDVADATVRLGSSILGPDAYGGGGLELMSEMNGDRAAYIDFHSNPVHLDYAARIMRTGGVDGELRLETLGGGGVVGPANLLPCDWRPIT